MENNPEIRSAVTDEYEWSAQLMARTDPWLTYNLSIEWCRNVLKWPGSSLFVAAASEPVGFVLVHPKGFLGSPYIAILGVAEHHRGRGIGCRMLTFAEQMTTNSRFVYLCVSTFNIKARRLYERQGYSTITEIPDLFADGYCEVLMRKCIKA